MQLLEECFDRLETGSVLNQQRQLGDERDAAAEIKSATGVEIESTLSALLFMAMVVLVVLFDSSLAEHLARGISRIQQAVRKNPGGPDFAGLEAYVGHCHELGKGLQTTVCDRYDPGLQKGVTAVLKRACLIEDDFDAGTSECGGRAENKLKDAAADAEMP